jgi:hypothetical protein
MLGKTSGHPKGRCCIGRGGAGREIATPSAWRRPAPRPQCVHRVAPFATGERYQRRNSNCDSGIHKRTQAHRTTAARRTRSPIASRHHSFGLHPLQASATRAVQMEGCRLGWRSETERNSNAVCSTCTEQFSMRCAASQQVPIAVLCHPLRARKGSPRPCGPGWVPAPDRCAARSARPPASPRRRPRRRGGADRS